MNKHSPIYILLIALVLLAFLFWHQRSVLPKNPLQQQETVESKAPTKNVSSNIQTASHTPNPPSPVGGSNTGTARLAGIAEEFIDSKNRPIDIYGQFIDQNSNPIPGVNIKVSIETLTLAPLAEEFVGSKHTSLVYASGSDGRFEVHGETGDLVGIGAITKDGYILSPKAPSGFGGGTSGSYESPVIFRMWKKGAEESLIGGRHVFGIDSGQIYTLDLITGKKIVGQAEGDLLVSITRPPDAKPRGKYQWSFSIQAIQGGFVQAEPDDEFMYVAPESGYQPQIEMQFDPNGSTWTGVVNERLFFCSRNGQVYGRADIEIDSIYNVHSAIQINYALNPNGSHNLQP